MPSRRRDWLVNLRRSLRPDRDGLRSERNRAVVLMGGDVSDMIIWRMQTAWAAGSGYSLSRADSDERRVIVDPRVGVRACNSVSGC